VGSTFSAVGLRLIHYGSPAAIGCRRWNTPSVFSDFIEGFST